jgi:hypothetical protein
LMAHKSQIWKMILAGCLSKTMALFVKPNMTQQINIFVKKDKMTKD